MLIEAENGFIARYEDGTEKAITLNISEDGENDSVKVYTDLYFAVFENAEGRTEAMGAYVDYYYNPATKEYSYQTHHEFETEYVVEGKCSENGCTVITTCKHCDYHSEYTRYVCDTEGTETDLKEYGLCGGILRTYTCRACGTVTSSYADDYHCNWNWVETKENGVEVYQCTICGTLKHSHRYYGEKDENCRYEYVETRVYYNANGKELFRFEN